MSTTIPNPPYSDISLPPGWHWEPLIRVPDHEDCMARRDPVSHVCCQRDRDNECCLGFCNIGDAPERQMAILIAQRAFSKETSEKLTSIRDRALDHLIEQHVASCDECRSKL